MGSISHHIHVFTGLGGSRTGPCESEGAEVCPGSIPGVLAATGTLVRHLVNQGDGTMCFAGRRLHGLATASVASITYVW